MKNKYGLFLSTLILLMNPVASTMTVHAVSVDENEQQRNLLVDDKQSKREPVHKAESFIAEEAGTETVKSSQESNEDLSLVKINNGEDIEEIAEDTILEANTDSQNVTFDELSRVTGVDLNLGYATQRTLPIPPVKDHNDTLLYDNVVYYDVANRADWEEALKKNNLDKAAITYMNIIGDFALTDTNNMIDVDLKTAISNKKWIINGNDHHIDFRGIQYQLANTDWDVVFQNLNAWSANNWGLVNGYAHGKMHTFTFHNLRHFGGQLSEGARSRVVLSGDTSIISTNELSYTSPIGDKTVAIDNSYRSSSNLGVGELYVKAGTNLYMENGRYASNFTIHNKGNFYVEDSSINKPTKIKLQNLKEPKISENKWPGGVGGDYSPASISIVTNVTSANHWSDAEAPANLRGREYFAYFGNNTQVDIHNGSPRKDYPSVLQIQGAGAEVQLAENATFIGKIDQDAGADNQAQLPFILGGSGNVNLGKSSVLDLTVGDGSSSSVQANGTALKIGGKGSIHIGEDAALNIRSDSTVLTGLVKLETQGSQVTIAKGGKLDLAFEEAGQEENLLSLDGVLSVPETGNYAHTIKQWKKDNFNEAVPDHLFQPLDETVITYKDLVIQNKNTKLANGFVDNGVVENFKTNYNSFNRRLVIEPLNYEVSLDEITNETKDTYTVSGTALPQGGKVLLGGGPFDDLPTSERTATVQTDGTFTWSGSLDRPFYTGEEITGTYQGDVNAVGKTIVVDVTKPTGVGREYHILEGESIPESVSFIEAVEDTNPANVTKDDFTYEFDTTEFVYPGNGIISNGENQQEYAGTVKITDAANNVSDPAVNVKLVVHKADFINKISANDYTAKWSEVSGFAIPSTEYQNYILEKTQAKAVTIKNGDLIELPIQIDNLSDIGNSIGGYLVNFGVVKTAENGLNNDLTKVVNWTVISNLTDPTDPSKPVPDPTDPSKNPENTGTGSNKDLRIDYVPSEFDFGTVKFAWSETNHKANGQTAENQWVQVADERETGNDWTLKVRATDFATTGDTLVGAALSLPTGKTFNKKTASSENPAGLSGRGLILTNTDQTIVAGSGENAKNESTYVWEKNAVNLSVPGGQGKVGKTYKSTITWTLETGVSN